MIKGLCECGCGEKTPICKETYRKLGYIKGEPLRFASGHENRNRKWTAEAIAKRAASMKGHTVSKETREKISKHHKDKGIRPSKEAVRLSNINRGKMEKNPSWRGGVTYVSGYKCRYNPDHVRAMPNGYVYEHILIIEKTIGRSLSPGEVTHHIDGNKLNNDPENLTSFPSQSEHIAFHRAQTALLKKP